MLEDAGRFFDSPRRDRERDQRLQGGTRVPQLRVQRQRATIQVSSRVDLAQRGRPDRAGGDDRVHAGRSVVGGTASASPASASASAAGS